MKVKPVEAENVKMDRLYLIFLLMSMIGGIIGWLRLRVSQYGIDMIAMSLFVFLGLFMVSKLKSSLVFNDYSVERQVTIAVLMAIPGIVLGRVMLIILTAIYFSGSWVDTLIVSLMSLQIVVVEETFRAAIYLIVEYLTKDANGKGNVGIAFLASLFMWILLHFIQHSFDITYFFWLFVVGFLFTLTMFTGGLGAAILCHYLVNILMSL